MWRELLKGRASRLAMLLAAIVVATPLAQGQPSREESRMTLKLQMLSRINRDRMAHGLAPVQFDPQASATADAYCEQQIRNGTTGHFTTDGLTPYMRYSFAGGNDGVSENAAAWSASYHFAERLIPGIMMKSQDAMLAETPPDDGHRRAILDPRATHVGIGLAWEKGEFRLAQEFIRRYVRWVSEVPRSASIDERVVVRGKPVEGFDVDAVSVYYEPVPRPMYAVTANRIERYGFPKNRRDFTPVRRNAPPDRRSEGEKLNYFVNAAESKKGRLWVARDGSFTFNVPFPDGAGVYTVVVWVKASGSREPFTASNISIRVSGREASTGGGAITAGGAR